MSNPQVPTGLRLLRQKHTPLVIALIIAVIVTVIATFLLMRESQPRPPSGSFTKEWMVDAPAGGDVDVSGDFDVVVREDGDRSLTVGSDGLTKTGMATQRNSATYLQKDLGAAVDRIGVTARFPTSSDGGKSGTVALLVGSAPVPDDPVRNVPEVPNLGVHFSFDANQWVMGLWEGAGGGLVTLGEASFPVPLSGDCSVDITRKADELVISLPDGTSRRFQDSRIASWSGHWGIWELYEGSPGDAPAAIRKLWASHTD